MKQWHCSLKMREKDRREIGVERKVGSFDETRGGKMAGELPFDGAHVSIQFDGLVMVIFKQFSSV